MAHDAEGSNLVTFNFTDFLVETSATIFPTLTGGKSLGFRNHITLPFREPDPEISDVNAVRVDSSVYTLPAVMPQEYTTLGNIWHEIDYSFDGTDTGSAVVGISWSVFKNTRTDLDATPTWDTESTMIMGASINMVPATPIGREGKVLSRERQISRGGCDNVDPGNMFQIRLRRLGFTEAGDTSINRLRIYSFSLYEAL